MFDMSVFCQVSFKGEVKKTATQSGQQPKWNECFAFEIEDDKLQNQVEFTVFHKPLFFAEEKIGTTLIVIHTKEECKHTDWFILKDDNDKVVGQILVCITIEQNNSLGTGDKKKSDLVNDLDEDYIDDNLQQLDKRG